MTYYGCAKEEGWKNRSMCSIPIKSFFNNVDFQNGYRIHASSFIPGADHFEDDDSTSLLIEPLDTLSPATYRETRFEHDFESTSELISDQYPRSFQFSRQSTPIPTLEVSDKR